MPTEAHNLSPAATTGPSNCVGITMDRALAVTDASVLVTGRVHAMGLYLPAGLLINQLWAMSGPTALSGATNQWMALYDQSRNRLVVSDDRTTTSWPANTAANFTLAGGYTSPYTGFYYIALMVKATTVPSLITKTVNIEISTLDPPLCGFANTGLTNPASAPAAMDAITPGTALPLAGASL